MTDPKSPDSRTEELRTLESALQAEGFDPWATISLTDKDFVAFTRRLLSKLQAAEARNEELEQSIQSQRHMRAAALEERDSFRSQLTAAQAELNRVKEEVGHVVGNHSYRCQKYDELSELVAIGSGSKGDLGKWVERLSDELTKLREEHRWIPCSERMPASDERVYWWVRKKTKDEARASGLFAYDGEFEISPMAPYRFTGKRGTWVSDETADYWMPYFDPIPAPPSAPEGGE